GPAHGYQKLSGPLGQLSAPTGLWWDPISYSDALVASDEEWSMPQNEWRSAPDNIGTCRIKVSDLEDAAPPSILLFWSITRIVTFCGGPGIEITAIDPS